MHTVGRTWKFLMFNLVVHTVTTSRLIVVGTWFIHFTRTLRHIIPLRFPTWRPIVWAKPFHLLANLSRSISEIVHIRIGCLSIVRIVYIDTPVFFVLCCHITMRQLVATILRAWRCPRMIVYSVVRGWRSRVAELYKLSLKILRIICGDVTYSHWRCNV